MKRSVGLALQMLIVMFVLFSSAAASAQTGGRISGTVRDSSGSVIPDIAIIARNTATGIQQTAVSNVGSGHDRPERARACQAGAAAAADDAHDRPRPDETSRHVIDPADRPHAPSAGSGPAGSPGTAHARETAGPGRRVMPCQSARFIVCCDLAEVRDDLDVT